MIGDRIKQLRRERNFTQGELADRANVNRSYISGIEHGHSSPTVDMIERIAQGLGVSLWVLLSEVEDRHFTYDSEEEYEMAPGLTDFLNDSDEMMYSQPTTVEIDELKKIVFRGQAKPDKRFYRDALLAIRRAEKARQSG